MPWLLPHFDSFKLI